MSGGALFSTVTELEPVALAAALPPDVASLPPVLTVEEVARFLRVNAKTVYEEIAAGRLPVVRLGRHGRVIRIARSVVACLLQGRAVLPGGADGSPA